LPLCELPMLLAFSAFGPRSGRAQEEDQHEVSASIGHRIRPKVAHVAGYPSDSSVGHPDQDQDASKSIAVAVGKKARVGIDDGGTAKMDYLHHLPRLLLGRIWPPERIVMGLRVCRWLHTELTAAAPHAVLKATENVDTTTPADLVKTLYAFRKCRVLLHWDSPTNRDTVVAGVSVAVSLGCTESIVHVDVGESKLGAKRAAALFQALGECSAIETLNLEEIRLCDYGAVTLCSVLRSSEKLTHISLKDNRGIGDGGAALLADALVECKALRHLDLSNCKLGTFAMRKLAVMMGHCTRLEHLSLADNHIRVLGASSLSKGLVLCPNFKHLDLSENKIGEAGVLCIAKGLDGLTCLTHLNLAGVFDSGSGSMLVVSDLVPRLPSLQYLNINSCPLVLPVDQAVWAIQRIGMCAKLRHLDMSNSISECSLEGLQGCSTLTHLNLSGMELGTHAAMDLASVLPHMPELSYLDLYRNEFHGNRELAVVIGSCSRLTYLDLGLSGISSADLDLRKCVGLTFLCLDDLRIGEAGTVTLAEWLPLLSALKELHLAHNAISDTGVRRLCAVLPQSTALHSLDLSSNAIGDCGAATLSGILGRLLSLSWLALHRNRIGDLGALRLAGGMIQCPTLSTCTITGNLMGEGSEVLAHAPCRPTKCPVHSTQAMLDKVVGGQKLVIANGQVRARDQIGTGRDKAGSREPGGFVGLAGSDQESD